MEVDNNMSKNLIAPLGRIIVKEFEKANKSIGGVILPSSVSDPENKSKVGTIVSNGVAAGNGNLDTNYSEGTEIYFGQYAGAVVYHNSEKYVSLTVNEVAAILK